MQTKFKLIVLFTVVAVFLVACSNNQTPMAKNQEKNPIVIGATLALSGDLAYIGQQEAKGTELAIEEINSAGGVDSRLLKLISEDNKGDVKEAVTSVTKLIDMDKSQIILPAFTHVTTPVSEITKSKNKLLIYASTVAALAKSNKYTFRDFYDTEQHGKFLVDLLNRQQQKKISILTENSDTCANYVEAIKIKTNQVGIQILEVVKYEVGQKDLRTEILKLQPENIDAIVTCTWRDNDIFMPTLKNLGLMEKQSYQIVAPFFPRNNTSEIHKLYEENGTITTWYGFTKDSNNPKYLDFKAKFVAKYGEEPTPDAVYFYDDMFVLRDALKTCDNKGQIESNDCIAEELLKTNYNGAGGRLTFDADGVSTRDVFAITVNDGEWVEVK